ncbi:KAP family NTPase [Kosakonia sp. HypNH10]|uniref:KAP family NTPase n=1 Tax=Kosakonia sp. HypNH10 TaxID=2980101 RepID=UPI00244A3F77|nr:KAP family NTPase [Kosakonia sp. HypNH10]MDH2911244.1 KAP family NTPase [Kosakonia sp. HypNH10]
MSWSFEMRDEYQRKAIAENLSKLIDFNNDISPIVIDGNWGTGKTEFSLKLQTYMIESSPSKKVIYIDAFKEDHCNDPLLSVTAAIAGALPEPTKKELIKKAIPAIKFTGATALKATVSWVLKQEANDLSSEFHKAITDTSDAAIENLINGHIESEEKINALKSKIKKITQDEKIVIIIDELDRCRPNFSIEMLEKIKHIFDIENLYFILITNLEQLKASVNHIYGGSVNSQSYLDKFIKYTLTLPETYKPDGQTAIHISLSHWKALVNCSLDHENICRHLERQFEELLSIRALSLRETETFFRYFSVFQTVAKNKISDGNNLIRNLTYMVAIYIYCFGDKREVASFPTTKSIASFASMMGINNPNNYKKGSRFIPKHFSLFYDMLMEAGMSHEELGVNQFEIDSIKKLNESINQQYIVHQNTTQTIKDAFNVFSLS